MIIITLLGKLQMKHSIKDIFKNLNTYLFFVFFVSFLAVVLTFEQQLSYKKTDILNEEKKIVEQLISLDKKERELALIQFNTKSIQLQQNIENLKTLYKYNFTDHYVLGNSAEYLKNLTELSMLIDQFNTVVQEYYSKTKKQKNSKEDLMAAFELVTKKIDAILLKSIEYDKETFNVVMYLVGITFILVLLATLWYRKMLHSIYEDISYLFKLDKSKGEYEIFSLEADGIALRMNRKSNVNDNPHLIDAVTGINNYKGLLHSYSHKKAHKEDNLTAVAILEIDNFSKSNRAYPQEVAQAMLKKVAYTISLNEQPADIIARTDYNKFTIVLSRSSKEVAFKEVDIIRENISELKFHVPQIGAVKVTVSGAFVVKPNNTSIQEALQQAEEILAHAKSIGKNHILQMKDLDKKEIQ
jgi:diguanylate cyclase (GGDEF)-like protein